MQDAVIAMAIIVVVLALWRLHSHPTQLGSIGPWAATNVFGSVTLSLLPGPKRAEEGNRPTPGPDGGPTPNSGTLSSIPTNTTVSASNPPAAIQGPPVSNQTLPINLLNPNEPVTFVPVLPGELVETPAESSALERRLDEVGA